ncbi:MAG: AsmA-like C-terminal region-containing protein [Burkholderiales bacterium]
MNLPIIARAVAERKAREEADRQIAIAQKAREDAERLAREAASGESAEGKQAREEAEYRAKMAEAAVAKAQAQAEAERKARAEAEERAKTEAVARVVREQELRENAEKNVKSLVDEELRARARAEIEADARYRAEAAERAKAAAADRKLRMESEARDAATSFRADRKPRNKTTIAVVILLVLVVGGLTALQFIPLTGYVPAVQAMLSQRLKQPVHISNMRYTVYPEQVLTLERVSIGSVQQIKADTVSVPMMPWTLLLGTREFDSVSANAVVIESSGLDLLPALAGAADRDALQLRQLQLTGVKINGTAVELPTLETQLTFGRNGAVQKFRLGDGKITINATPKDKGLALVIDAREWVPPVGPALQFSDLSITAQVDRQQATFSAISGRIASGRLKGAMQASWGGNIKIEGEFNLENAQLQHLIPAFTREFLALGSVNMNGSFALQGKTLKTLFDAAETEATFTVDVGEMNNVDLVRAIQSPAPGGTRGGKTKFDTLAGSLSAANGRISYKQLQLASGPLNASGAINVGSDSALSGRISAELGSRGLVVARGSLNVTGAVRDPLLRP